MEPTDEVLCQRVADRDEAAFDLLVARYQERAYRLAWSILRNAEDARDLSQEAFIRLSRSAHRIRAPTAAVDKTCERPGISGRGPAGG